jgi:hypothetical protein
MNLRILDIVPWVFLEALVKRGLEKDSTMQKGDD